MSLKSFDEMRKIDVKPYCEQRDGCDYLNWAKVIDLLHENGAETAYFEPVTNSNGSSLFMADTVFTDKNGNTNRCYEVRVKVYIDDKVYDFQTALMNGGNPVKDNSMSQQRVWNAQTRAFVKCVAIHTGLGFDLWLKDEGKEEDNNFENDMSKHKLAVIRKRVEELVTIKLNSKSMPEILAAMGMEEETFRAMFAKYNELYNFEKKLAEI